MASEEVQALRAVTEIANILKESRVILVKQLQAMDKALQGNPMGWLERWEAIDEMDPDDAKAALMVAVGAVSNLRIMAQRNGGVPDIRRIMGIDDNSLTLFDMGSDHVVE